MSTQVVKYERSGFDWKGEALNLACTKGWKGLHIEKAGEGLQ